MSLYELLLIGHVIAVIIWLGAGFLLGVLVIGATRARDPEKEAAIQRDIDWLSPRLFVPASLATVVLGVLLVIDGPWGFDQFWVTFGLSGWLASFGLGFFYFRTEGARLAALAAGPGPRDPEFVRRSRTLYAIDRFQLLILFLVVADMLVKPTGDDPELLIAGAVILAAGAMLAVVAASRAGRAAQA